MAISKIPAEAWAVAELVYPEGGSALAMEALRKLGHEASSWRITQHMKVKGITYNDPDRWTDEEIATLKEHSSRMSSRMLKERFFPSRTIAAVELQRARLGLRGTNPNADKGGRTEPMLRLGPWDGECRVVFLGDQQCPEIDWQAHKVVCQFLEFYMGLWHGPKVLVCMGDGLNATTLGRFDYDPDTPPIEDEIADYKRVLSDYAKACGPGTEAVVIEGNHEYRLWKLIQRDPRLHTLIEPWPKLLDLGNIFERWHWVPYMGGFVEFPGEFLATHGYRVSQHSAYAAKQHMENTGMSGIAGHTHRLGSHFKVLYNRSLRWYENGSLCVPQSYVAGVANWSLGFTHGYWRGERFSLSQIEIINGTFHAAGAWYGPPDPVTRFNEDVYLTGASSPRADGSA